MQIIERVKELKPMLLEKLTFQNSSSNFSEYKNGVRIYVANRSETNSYFCIEYKQQEIGVFSSGENNFKTNVRDELEIIDWNAWIDAVIEAITNNEEEGEAKIFIKKVGDPFIVNTPATEIIKDNPEDKLLIAKQEGKLEIFEKILVDNILNNKTIHIN